MSLLKLSPHSWSLWRFAVPVLAALALVVPSTASAAAFTTHLSAPNHTPTANKAWPIKITITRGSAKLSGNVRYSFLFNGSVVRRVAGHSFTNGLYRDTLTFPSEAVGYSLTLRIIVTTKYGQVYIPWAVKTRA
jgi:hypothetical protein